MEGREHRTDSEFDFSNPMFKKKNKKGDANSRGGFFGNSKPLRSSFSENSSVWIEHKCEEGENAGQSYYHQPSTGETVWDRPEGKIKPAEVSLDEKWNETEDSNGEKYWYDEVSGRTTWSDRSQG